MIASVTLTRNDWHSLRQWRRFYEDYASALALHVIVDNASTPEYQDELKKLFPDSVHLHRSTNGGTTGAYNSGIRYLLERHPEVDCILLIANDIEISRRAVAMLGDRLSSDGGLGAAAPILLQGDGRTICAYGEKLRSDLGLIRLHDGEMFVPGKLPEEQESECLPGGICMVKSCVYRQVGLQDESLFMYFDENDFFLRVTRAGYRLVALRDATAAHCHIVTEGKANDSSLAWFYLNRNQFLLCHRYASGGTVLKLLLRKLFWYGPRHCAGFVLRERSWRKVVSYYRGLFCGLFQITGNTVSN